MALSFVSLTNNGATGSISSQATASISPSANKLYLLAVSSRLNSSIDPNQPTATGNGLTWVAEKAVSWDIQGGSRKKLTVFRAMGASPSNGAVTIDFAAQAQTDVIWEIVEVSGMDTGGTNGSGAVVQSASNLSDQGGGGTLTVTLAAFGSANNGTFGFFVSDETSGTTPTVGTGFTQLTINTTLPSGGSVNKWLSEYRTDNDTSVDATFGSSALANTGGIALEIKLAAAGEAAPAKSIYLTTNSKFFGS